MTWKEAQAQKRAAQRAADRPADNEQAKETCPLCALDIRRIPAFHEKLYPKFHIYSCVMWGDVYHTVTASLGIQVGGAVLIRFKGEK